MYLMRQLELLKNASLLLIGTFSGSLLVLFTVAVTSLFGLRCCFPFSCSTVFIVSFRQVIWDDRKAWFSLKGTASVFSPGFIANGHSDHCTLQCRRWKPLYGSLGTCCQEFFSECRLSEALIRVNNKYLNTPGRHVKFWLHCCCHTLTLYVITVRN